MHSAPAMMLRTTLFSLAVASAGCLVGEEIDPPQAPHIAARTAGLFGLNVQADGARSDVVSDLGAQWVRVELIDGSTGPELASDAAARFERVLDDYHARNMRVLVIFDYSSYGGNAGFGPSGACGDWEGYRGRWTERLQRVSARYGSRIDGWEIWNEPDQPILPCDSGDYNPGIPSGDYGIMLRDAYSAIRNGGSSAPIITAGLDSGQVAYIREAGDAAGGLYADGVSIHPYGVVPDSSWCPDPGEDLNCDWGTLGGKVDEYYNATGLPVWITEFGIKTQDTQHAANYLAGAYTAFESRGEAVAHAFFFCESDAMVPPFGLTFADGSPKPDVYAMYRALTGGGGGGGGGGGEDPPPPPPGLTQQLHGTVEVGGNGLEGIWVSAWGHTDGDFHVVKTDALGIYAFTDLNAASQYNVVVNGQFEPSAPGGYVALDGDHAYDVHNNIVLESGPDGWHGENFSLAY
jgi:hypothetical protein